VYGGVTYKQNVPFTVNISYLNGSLLATTESMTSKYTAIESTVKTKADQTSLDATNKTLATKANQTDLDTTNAALADKASTADLKKVESSIEQTARKISLSVSEATIGRRNLLTGTAIASASDMVTHVGDLADTTVSIVNGYNGTNAARGSANYKGSFRWWGGYNGNIKVEKGKSYTASCYVKTDHAVKAYCKCFYESSATDTSRPGKTGVYPFYQEVTTLNEWQLLTGTFSVPSDSAYEYLEVYFFCIESSGSGYHYMARPMLEEGEEYCGWTKSENDLDIVGGNLLDGTRTLSTGGNAVFYNGTITANGYGNSSVSEVTAPSSGDAVAMQWLSPMVANEDYIMSFMAKGSGTIQIFAYKDNTDAKVWTESCDGLSAMYGDGDSTFTLTSQWKRYWMHWSPRDASVLPQTILLRVNANSTAYFTEPKLERGAQVTEYTERSSDLVDSGTLKQAGIDITSGSVVLYGGKVKIETNGTTAAMFTDGKLSADYLDLAGASIYKDMMYAKQFHIPYSDAYLQHYVPMGITSFADGDLVFYGHQSDDETYRLCVTAKQSYSGTSASDGASGTVTVKDDSADDSYSYIGTWHTATWLYEQFMASGTDMGGETHKYHYGGIYSDFGINFKTGQVQGYRSKFNTLVKQATNLTYAWNFRDIRETDDLVFIPASVTSSNAIGFPEPTSALVGKVIEVYLAYSSYTYHFTCSGTNRMIDMTDGYISSGPSSTGFYIKGAHSFKMICQERGIFSSTDDTAVDPYWIVYDAR
jgi:hypothetical protein